ncbi:MAG: DUF4150 domain-containing protein [Pseudomonadota bacterium]
MANDVFANGREISCKKADGKSIAAFPDVCMTPPTAPPTPPGVPLPYPNTAMAKDCAGGSKTVKISGAEVMLKNKSYFKTSTGDEAGSAPKKGVMTSKIKGKAYFTMWSMDVKAQGENVIRHFDLSTHNHGSQPGQTPPWPYADSMAVGSAGGDPCESEKKAEQDACSKHDGARDKECEDDACVKAQACRLVPYRAKAPGIDQVKQSSPNCCPGYTGDHIVEASSFANKRGGAPLKGCEGYDLERAPTCCVKGGAYSDDHGFMSALRGVMNLGCEIKDLTLANGKTLSGKRVTTYKEAKENGARSVRSVHTHCDEGCIAAQLEAYDKESKIADDTEVRAITYGQSENTIGRIMRFSE